MTALSIDTCGLKYSIALLNGENILKEILSEKPNMQCEELIDKIEMILYKNNLTYKDIHMLVVTNGPGSFNGVRIGMSAAYGISLVTGVEIVTVSTFAVMALKFKATKVLFKADEVTGFLQQFNEKYQAVTDVQQVNLNEIEDKTIVQFNVNDLYMENQNISNAVAAAIIAIKYSQQQENLFYGKEPSIHRKL